MSSETSMIGLREQIESHSIDAKTLASTVCEIGSEKSVASVNELKGKGNIADPASRISNRPPSNDLANKVHSLREETDKKQGGQEGHEGHTMQIPDGPYMELKRYPERCLNCKNFDCCPHIKERETTRDVVDSIPVVIHYKEKFVDVRCPMHSEDGDCSCSGDNAALDELVENCFLGVAENEKKAEDEENSESDSGKKKKATPLSSFRNFTPVGEPAIAKITVLSGAHEGSEIYVTLPSTSMFPDTSRVIMKKGDPDAENSETIGAEKSEITDVQETPVFLGKELTEEDCNEMPVIRSDTKGVSPVLQYGPNIVMLVLVLANFCMVSGRRIQTFLFGLIGLNISPGTMSNWGKKFKETLKPAMKAIKKALKESTVVHADETGVRQNGNAWFHTLCNNLFTHIHFSVKRGVEGIKAGGILDDFKGIVVHDCWSSYWSLDKINNRLVHAICMQHILRELLYIIVNCPDAMWARQLYNLLVFMDWYRNRLLAAGKRQMDPEIIKLFLDTYDLILEQGEAGLLNGANGAEVDVIAGESDGMDDEDGGTCQEDDSNDGMIADEIDADANMTVNNGFTFETADDNSDVDGESEDGSDGTGKPETSGDVGAKNNTGAGGKTTGKKTRRKSKKQKLTDKQRALINRLKRRKAEATLFLTNFEVPFTNNAAERSFRLVKVKMSVSGCFRSEEGAESFAAAFSWWHTAKLHGFNPFQAFSAAILGDWEYIIA